MRVKQIFGQNKNNNFHPSWILIIVALTILIGGVVWVIAELVPGWEGQPERLPSLTPTGPKIIMVANSDRIS